jgi:outer membrane protein assembly factor BamA
MTGRLFTVCAALSFVAFDAGATIQSRDLGDVEVKVEGARRTKLRLVESLVEKCIEREGFTTWDAVDGARLGQCISNTRLFRRVEVRVNRPEIDVTLVERWTLIPIPNFYASDGKRSAGIFVFDSNFLGYGKTVGAGGGISTEGNTFSLMYSDKSVNFTDYTFMVMASASNTETDAYVEHDIVYGYEKRETGFIISPGYKITPSFEASFSFGYGDRKYSTLDSFPAPGDYESTTIGFRLSYRNANYKLFYNDGLSASIKWSRQVHRSDSRDSVSQTAASLEWDVMLFQKHALQLGLHGDIQSDNGNPGDVSTHGRGKGYRGIEPNGLWSRKIAATSADYQIPVAKTGHGTFTVAPFVDYGMFQPYFPANGSNYMAYGIGAYYFINLINFPGVGLVVGRNQDFMGTFVSLQIGTGFF